MALQDYSQQAFLNYQILTSLNQLDPEYLSNVIKVDPTKQNIMNILSGLGRQVPIRGFATTHYEDSSKSFAKLKVTANVTGVADANVNVTLAPAYHNGTESVLSVGSLVMNNTDGEWYRIVAVDKTTNPTSHTFTLAPEITGQAIEILSTDFLTFAGHVNQEGGSFEASSILSQNFPFISTTSSIKSTVVSDDNVLATPTLVENGDGFEGKYITYGSLSKKSDEDLAGKQLLWLLYGKRTNKNSTRRGTDGLYSTLSLPTHPTQITATVNVEDAMFDAWVDAALQNHLSKSYLVVGTSKVIRAFDKFLFEKLKYGTDSTQGEYDNGFLVKMNYKCYEYGGIKFTFVVDYALEFAVLSGATNGFYDNRYFIIPLDKQSVYIDDETGKITKNLDSVNIIYTPVAGKKVAVSDEGMYAMRPTGSFSGVKIHTETKVGLRMIAKHRFMSGTVAL